MKSRRPGSTTDRSPTGGDSDHPSQTERVQRNRGVALNNFLTQYWKIITLHIMLLSATFNTGVFAERNGFINYPLLYTLPVPQTPSDDPALGSGFIVWMDEELLSAPEALTSLQAPYLLGEHICEINAGHPAWTAKADLPFYRFLFLRNPRNQYETYCLVIGKIDDTVDRVPILNVSKEVAYDLMTRAVDNLALEVRVLYWDEWQTSKEAVNLRSLYIR